MNIDVRNFTRRFADRVVVDIASLHIASGSIVGLSGDNGSGKTTLLRALAGLDENYQGEVLYDGRPYSKRLAGSIVYVHQQPVMLRRTVYANLEYPLKLQSLDPAVSRAKIEAMLDRFELRSFQDQRATRLSGGETQKLALARALLRKPKVILLDEPTASLDGRAVDDVLDILLDYQRAESATIILVSHGEKDIRRVARRIITLDRGSIASDIEIASQRL